jgi:hypothetical protein
MTKWCLSRGVATMKSTFDLYGLAKIEGITEISLRSGVLG